MLYNHEMIQRIQTLRQRVQNLYRRAQENPTRADLLSGALEELSATLTTLDLAESLIQRQNDERNNQDAALEVELQRYRELFTEAPVSYIVTSPDGTIRQANEAATGLLQVSAKSLIGRSLAHFVPEGQRRGFRAALAQLGQSDSPQTWSLRLHTWHGELFDALLTVQPAVGRCGKPQALRWLLQPSSDEVSVGLQRHIDELEQQLAAAGQQLDNARSEGERLQISMRQRYHFLASACQLLAASHDASTTLGQIANLAIPQLGIFCAFDLLANDGSITRLGSLGGLRASDTALSFHTSYLPDHKLASIILDTLQTGRPQLKAALQKADLQGLALDQQQQRQLAAVADASLLIVPIQGQHSALGACIMIAAQPDFAYTPADLSMLEELAERVAVAVSTWQRWSEPLIEREVGRVGSSLESTKLSSAA